MKQKFGTVFDIKRYALHDGPGIRVTVHLKGCPLSCWWCHNPESRIFEPQLLFRPDRCIGCSICEAVCPNGAILSTMDTDNYKCNVSGKCADACPSGAREICGRRTTTDEIMEIVTKEKIFFDQSGGGVTISGGEPLVQFDFTMALLEECKKREISTAIDTCGFVDRQNLLDAIPLTDIFLYDIKHMDPDKHRLYTGVENEVIKSNLIMLGDSGARIFARAPFVPGINTDEDNIRATGKFLARVKGVELVNLLPYHTAAEDKHRRWGLEFRSRGARPPTENMLTSSAAIIESFGLPTAIGG